MNNKKEQFNILLVEDNDDHAEIIEFYIKEYSDNTTVHRIDDGEKAIEYIKRQAAATERSYRSDEQTENSSQKDKLLQCNSIKEFEKGNNSHPHLIILDLKLPKYDGHEVLQEIKKSRNFKKIPVVIFTTSNSSLDIGKALYHSANSYILKPIEQNKFKEVLGMIIAYWKMNERVRKKKIEP